MTSIRQIQNVGLRGAVIWAIYVRTVEKCIRYNGIEPFGTATLENNFNRLQRIDGSRRSPHIQSRFISKK